MLLRALSELNYLNHTASTLPGNFDASQIIIVLSTEAVANHISSRDQAISSTSPEWPRRVEVHLQVSTLTLPFELNTALFPIREILGIEYFASKQNRYQQLWNRTYTPWGYFANDQIMMSLSSPPDAKYFPELLHRTQFTQAENEHVL